MEKIKIDDFLNYKFLSNMEFSPNGKNTAFILHNMNLESNNYDSNIHIYNASNNNTLKLTSTDEELYFKWMNENEIVFPSFRDSNDLKRKDDFETFTPFYKININGGEANRFFEIPMSVNSFEFIDKDNIIFTGKFDHSKRDFDNLSLEDKLESKDYLIMDELPFWGNGKGDINKLRNPAYIYNISSGEIKQINDNFTNTLLIQLNGDNTKALILSRTFKDMEPLKMDLSLYDIEKGELKLLDSDNYIYSFADFIQDKIIFIGTDMKRYGMKENPHIFTMDLDGNNLQQISDNSFDSPAGSTIGSDCRYGSYRSFKVDGDFLYFLTTEGDSSNLKRINLNGDIENLTESLGSIDGIDISDGKIQFIGLRNLKLQELYSLNGEENQITHFNDWIYDKRSISKPEAISFDTDGVTIHGWVMKPVNFDSNKKYPTILNIHGGPKTAFGETFFHEMQYWTNKGYGVIFCNPRGSDGKGNEFADIRGRYGSIDYEDLMNFTDFCIENYEFIDENRLGVTGGSYGGFMTNWIIGHTDRFKAAASQRSISNWFSFFGTTDIGYFFTEDQQSSTPWDNPEKLWALSPLKYANRVTTPTLFIHSAEDFRCWAPEALQMFSALKYHGVDSRVCLFKDENHELSRSGMPKHRIKRLKEITEWFDKYL